MSAGFQTDSIKDACRTEDVRSAELEIRETARGAERANDLIESMTSELMGIITAG